MLEILTTTKKDEISSIINGVPRLNEVVFVVNKPSFKYPIIEIDGDKIQSLPDWSDSQPPVLFPTLAYSKDELLGLVFTKLSNFPKAESYSISKELENTIACIQSILKSRTIESSRLTLLCQEQAGNEALLHHYAMLEKRSELNEIADFYFDTLDKELDSEVSAFIAKHFANFLIDTDKADIALKILLEFPPQSENKLAQASYNNLLGSCYARITDADEENYTKSQNHFDKAFNGFEKIEMKINAGLVLMEAGEWSDLHSDFASSNKQLAKAISIFKNEEQMDLYVSATMKKGSMLYHWSKNGSPQYFKQAINAFQEVLKYVNQDNAPWEFANAQLQLAQLYAEIPADEKERALWAAFSASAFKASIEVFNKEEYPYEYANACHNYATALSYYPDGKLRSNFYEANELFKEALEIRTADHYPNERAITIVNQLEVLWMAKFDNLKEKKSHYDSMLEKTKEVLRLTTDEKLIGIANKHLTELESVAISN